MCSCAMMESASRRPDVNARAVAAVLALYASTKLASCYLLSSYDHWLMLLTSKVS